MKYTHKVQEDILILKFDGDLIGENHGQELVSIANDNINDNITYCIIDISDVRYINSSGIGVLITLLTKFRNKEGEVILVKPSKSVEKLLLITKLSSIFQIANSTNEAVAMLKKVQ